MRQSYRTDTHTSFADLLRLSGRHSCSALVSVNRGRLPTRRLRVTSTRSLKFWNSKNWPMPSSESRVRVYLSNRGEWHGLLECCRTRLTDTATTGNVLLLVWSWSPSLSCCSWTSRQVVWVCPRSCRRSSGELELTATTVTYRRPECIPDSAIPQEAFGCGTKYARHGPPAFCPLVRAIRLASTSRQGRTYRLQRRTRKARFDYEGIFRQTGSSFRIV